jgi:hypothetical protein
MPMTSKAYTFFAPPNIDNYPLRSVQAHETKGDEGVEQG